MGSTARSSSVNRRPSAGTPDLGQTLASTIAPDTGQPADATVLDHGSVIGRYVVLSTLGSGSMGVVFAAHDPQLDRKVALKLLTPARRNRNAARIRLQREARAQARLNHPNVIGVLDVGEHDGQVFVAMELVEGQTLGAWLSAQSRSWTEVVEVFVATGRGLAAAHEAGIVHRDFKPENVMVDETGTARVMDFGLARSDEDDDAPSRPDSTDSDSPLTRLTRTGALLGTPAYMAPEQFAGAPSDPRADQFSFCAALHEALFGQLPFRGSSVGELCHAATLGEITPVPPGSPVPRWLRAVVLRGLAPTPAERWPSMNALLTELQRGKAHARTRRVLIGLTVLATLGGGTRVYERQQHAQRVVACEDAGDAIVDTWNPSARQTAHDAILATDVNYAASTANKVLPLLDEHAEAWRRHRTRACTAIEVEGSLVGPQADRVTWCLEDRRLALAALVQQLQHADRQVVTAAVSSAQSLGRSSSCTDPASVTSLPPPPSPSERARSSEIRAQLSLVGVLAAAGKHDEALTAVRPVVAQAHALGWPPLSARARLMQGRLLFRTGAYAASQADLEDAYIEASKARAWEVAAVAAEEMAMNLAEQAKPDEARQWVRHAEAAASHLQDELGLRRAARLVELAWLDRRDGDYASAAAAIEEVLEVHEQALGPDHPTTATTLSMLAGNYYLAGAYSKAQPLFERALAIREKALGSDHPAVGQSLNNLALLHDELGDYERSQDLLRRALDNQERALGPDHPDVASCRSNLAASYSMTGDLARAEELHSQALAIRERRLGHDHPDVAESLDNLASVRLMRGAYAEARPLYERALAIQENVLGPDHPDVARTLGNLGALLMREGSDAEAKPILARALAIRTRALGADHPAVATNLEMLASCHVELGEPGDAMTLFARADEIRRTHQVPMERQPAHRFALARALVETGGDRDRALAEARAAADELRPARADQPARLADVEAWLRKHGDALEGEG